MCGSAALEELDYYLRTIWLECCGHLSRITIGGMLYDRPSADSGYLERIGRQQVNGLGTGVVEMDRANAPLACPGRSRPIATCEYRPSAE